MTIHVAHHIDSRQALNLLCVSNTELGTELSCADVERILRNGLWWAGHNGSFNWRAKYTDLAEIRAREIWATEQLRRCFPALLD
jgi:hypothetical protein